MDPVSVIDDIIRTAATVLRIDPASLGPDSDFFAMGGDSLAAIEFVAALEESYDLDLDLDRFASCGRLSELSRQLLAAASTE